MMLEAEHISRAHLSVRCRSFGTDLTPVASDRDGSPQLLPRRGLLCRRSNCSHWKEYRNKSVHTADTYAQRSAPLALGRVARESINIGYGLSQPAHVSDSQDGTPEAKTASERLGCPLRHFRCPPRRTLHTNGGGVRRTIKENVEKRWFCDDNDSYIGDKEKADYIQNPLLGKSSMPSKTSAKMAPARRLSSAYLGLWMTLHPALEQGASDNREKHGWLIRTRS